MAVVEPEHHDDSSDRAPRPDSSGSDAGQAFKKRLKLGDAIFLTLIVVVVVALANFLYKGGFKRSGSENPEVSEPSASPIPVGSQTDSQGTNTAPAGLNIEAIRLITNFSNETVRMAAMNRKLTAQIEDGASQDALLRGAVEDQTKFVRRLNGAKMSENVERYVAGVNPSADTPGPQKVTSSRIANYIWDTPEKVGGFWVDPGNYAKVRIHGGVAFRVDPDRGLKVWVVTEGGTKTSFETWKANNNRLPVESFEVSNPSNEPLYCNFMPE